MPRLTIIIVSYNVKYYVEQCLLSVERARKGLDAEVYVVDNHSTDGSVSHLRKRFRHVHFIANNHNLGFARANNMAIRRTKSDYVLLLNPDTIIAEDTLLSCLTFMDEHPDTGAVGVRMMNDNGTDAMESRRGVPSPMTAFYKMCGLCKMYPKHPRYGHYYMSGMPWDEAGEMEIVSGAFCFLRRTALDKIGLLDEDFFMYGEDIDLSYRLLKAGYHNWYLPLRILHYKGESTEKTSFRYVHVFYDAMLIFFRKHYGGMSVLLSIPIKSAIYTWALVALVKATWQRTKKSLGFYTPYKKSKDDSQYLRIDISQTSFANTLNQLATQAEPRKHLMTYNPQTGLCITTEDVTSYIDSE